MVMALNSRSPGISRQYFYALIFVFTVNALSAILFMFLVRRPVYDDGFNMYDVHAYAAHGISIATIQAQRNPPGPTSFIWMASAARLIGHDELFDARIAVLLSWILLAVVMLVGARHSQWPHLWYGAFLAALVFPHSMTASASALTEGPALLFALLGVLAWTEAASRQDRVTSTSLALGVVGGLSMGLAITCRQYYLALLPSAGVLTIVLLKGRAFKGKFQWLVLIVTTIIVALIPVLIMVFIWRGITSPSMAAGTSYGNYQAGVGLAWFRLVVVIFYAAFYLVPFSFPAMWRVPQQRRWPVLLIALLVGLAATIFRDSLLNPGPLQSLVGAASRIPPGATLLFWLIASVTTYNSVAVCLLLWSERSRLLMCAPAIFAVLVFFFFIVEQLGVGGNIPFYDRYVLQLAPFLGIIGFWLFPRFTRSRILAMAGLAALSQGMLWRHAFGR